MTMRQTGKANSEIGKGNNRIGIAHIMIASLALLSASLTSCKVKSKSKMVETLTEERADSLSYIKHTEAIGRWDVARHTHDYKKVRIVEFDTLGRPMRLTDLEDGYKDEVQVNSEGKRSELDSLMVQSSEDVASSSEANVKTETKVQPIFPGWVWIVGLIAILGIALRLSPAQLLRRILPRDP